MYRSAINALLQWKNKDNRKPLIIMGARQVGKTWLMKEFGRTNYDKVAYIYTKLVDCLEKCLICRHIRRFAD